MIELEGVSRSLGDARVLSGIDLTVGRGELVGLVGPNGAGKTTLLRTVNGLLAPDSGTVAVDGGRVADLGAKAIGRRVATVPQDTHLSFAFTVEQVVEMGRTPHRSRLDWQEATAAVDRALERTETAHLADRTVDEISGGERQRVLLARALAQEAPALVLDEPTASLDVNHQVRVLELVRSLVDEGRTALAAIHDLDLAARYCDRLAVLSEGEILAAGPPRSVLTADRVEQAFGTVAAVSENALTGTPRVTAVGRRPDRDVHVHVTGTGSRAARALGECWRAGFDVSVGVVPKGDVAAALAADLDQPAVTAPAFGPVGDGARDALRELLDRSDVLVQATADPDPAGVVATADVPVVEVADPDDLDAAATVTEDPNAATDPARPIAPPAPGSGIVEAVVAELPGTAHGDD